MLLMTIDGGNFQDNIIYQIFSFEPLTHDLIVE